MISTAMAPSEVNLQMPDVTRILDRAKSGERAAVDELVAMVYAELHTMARRSMRAERADHTLQPTALAHEAYLRLVGDGSQTWENRAHFFASAATAIRRILVEHARKRSRLKRGGDLVRSEVEPDELLAEGKDERLLSLEEALERLAKTDPRKARVVELRYFAALTVEEVAAVLRTSPSTIARDWRLARAWLHSELEES